MELIEMLTYYYQTKTLSFLLNDITETVDNVSKHFNEDVYYVIANPTIELVIDFSFNRPRGSNGTAHYILRELGTDNYYIISVDDFENLLKLNPNNN